ncbi:MAG: preprotein translocase subunit SecY [Spirochaetes bacterium GWB1_48_6]|nr:MAG: preprotein translocase subunit SecY [Spirochaetes bacterium GWB1_48_6]
MANPILDIFKIKELRDRILFTLGILLVFRIGAMIPIPGVDAKALTVFFEAQRGSGTGITDYFDFFSGGAFSNFSIFMLGIMPYISSSIIMQLLLLVFPKIKKISQEDGGRKKIQRFTRWGTVGVALLQSMAVTVYANSIPGAISATMNPMMYTVMAMLTVTVGTLLLMWMGEQINQRGIGNGISLIIFTGIVAQMPTAVMSLVTEIQNGSVNAVFALIVAILWAVVIALVVFEQQGQRKIPVNYAKRVVGRKMYGAQNTYIPFKINPSGVIPVIFASSVLMFPLQLAQNIGSGADIGWLNTFVSLLDTTGPVYLTLYTLLIVFFAYFYTQVSLNPIEISKQIREHGGSIPGIRSENMEEYLTKILNRIILPGSLFLAFIALIPSLVQILFNLPSSVAYLMGGTSLLILVGVDLDTMSQIEGHLRMHHHDGLSKKGKIKSRNL